MRLNENRSEKIKGRKTVCRLKFNCHFDVEPITVKLQERNYYQCVFTDFVDICTDSAAVAVIVVVVTLLHHIANDAE